MMENKPPKTPCCTGLLAHVVQADENHFFSKLIAEFSVSARL